MPPDHLTLIAAVRTVITGAPLDEAAVTVGLDPADLADAVATYHAGGEAALHQHTDSHWYQVRVEFSDWDAAEHVAATQLGPALDHLTADGAVEGWWFLRKHPCWRLRFAGPDIPAVDRVLDRLVAAGAIARWWPTVYEPETTAFGGPTGIAIVHDLFCADSSAALAYLRQPEPNLGRRELSLLLLGELLHAAGLDWFERGDVFARVAQIRPTHTGTDARLLPLTNSVRGLLGAAPHTDALFTANGPASSANRWRAACIGAGHRLGAAAADGTLHRGLRAILTHVVIFHWNRFGLAAHTQAALAHAARDAFLPRS